MSKTELLLNLAMSRITNRIKISSISDWNRFRLFAKMHNLKYRRDFELYLNEPNTKYPKVIQLMFDRFLGSIYINYSENLSSAYYEFPHEDRKFTVNDLEIPDIEESIYE